MKKFICVAFASLIVASCATTTEYANKAVEYTKQAGSWIGQKVESLYAKEGTPSAVEPQPDGGKVIEYQHNQTVDTAQGSKPNAAPSLAGTNTQPTAVTTTKVTPETANTRIIPCTTRYRSDSTGTIRSWTIDGAGCKAVEETPSSHP